MARLLHSYTIYQSPNAYLGTVLLRRRLRENADVTLRRRPIFVPRDRGVLVSEMLGGKENRNAGSYNREDCRRWADRYDIPFQYPNPEILVERSMKWSNMPFHREELAARAYYAADHDKRDVLDEMLFYAVWVNGLDVNEPETIASAATHAGLDGAALLLAASREGPAAEAAAALREFEWFACPGVPTVVLGSERFFGKDRVDWILPFCQLEDGR